MSSPPGTGRRSLGLPVLPSSPGLSVARHTFQPPLPRAVSLANLCVGKDARPRPSGRRHTGLRLNQPLPAFGPACRGAEPPRRGKGAGLVWPRLRPGGSRSHPAPSSSSCGISAPSCSGPHGATWPQPARPGRLQPGRPPAPVATATHATACAPHSPQRGLGAAAVQPGGTCPGCVHRPGCDRGQSVLPAHEVRAARGLRGGRCGRGPAGDTAVQGSSPPSKRTGPGRQQRSFRERQPHLSPDLFVPTQLPCRGSPSVAGDHVASLGHRGGPGRPGVLLRGLLSPARSSQLDLGPQVPNAEGWRQP